jgi:serine phosphatase RsbU (regulator of sigma subunit)
MAQRLPEGRIITRIARIAALLALLILAARPASAEYWEDAESFAEGRFPSFFATKAGPLLIWQESRTLGESGTAKIRFARFEGSAWKRGEVSPSSYSYQTAGSPPILYSATQAKDGTIGVAIAASGTRIEVRMSKDGGRSFESEGLLETSTTSVAPRIYPSASGGWLIFATQGRAAAETAAAAAGAPSSLSIYVAKSQDGSTWGRFEPLVTDDENLLMNFAPSCAPYASKDVVFFQTFILGEGDRVSRYALMSKTSSDGGATWTKAKAVSDFDADALSWDNQGPQLLSTGGSLYAAWERHKTKSTQTHVWAARVDESGLFATGTAVEARAVSGSYMLSQIYDAGGSPALIIREDKLKSNRILLSVLKNGTWTSDDLDLVDKSDVGGPSLVTFARSLLVGGRSFLAWQLDTGDLSRIFTMVPDTSAAAPSLVPLNFTVGKRSRAESVEFRLDASRDASGIKDFAYIWKKTADKGGPTAAPSASELWKSGVKLKSDQNRLSLPATQDGAWTFWAAVEDNAGNRSDASTIGFYRKRIPPDAPILLKPELDEKGALESNSFTLGWLPPEADDLAGYTWDLAYAGPLENTGSPLVRATIKEGEAERGKAVPGFSDYESYLLRSFGQRLPPPGLMGAAPSFSANNVENGYYVFSVSAIDTTGNISGVASLLLKADKYKPYTMVTQATGSRDEVGRSLLRIQGRGFLADGRIERVVVDRNGREPYDIDRSLAAGEYHITSDREVDGLSFEDIQAGTYRIGLYHSTRGWYWTGPVVAIDSSGTIKYGLSADYKPSLRLFAALAHGFSIYDAIVFMAILFAALGILLSSRQAIAVAREGELMRREAIALITGGPMPQAGTKKAARALKRRGAGLRTKFTLTIAFLVIFVVLLLSVSLGYNMIKRTSSDLAAGLDQRARVLLESVAQGGRFFLGKEDAVTQLSLFPSQARAMKGAEFITITGYGQNPKVASGEVVYATNDPAITDKVEASTLNVDRAIVLGQSAFKVQGSDLLAPLVAAKAKEIGEKAGAAVADQLQLKVRLAQEKASLKAGAAGAQRRSEINTELDSIDVKIRDKLAVLSDQEIGSLPNFDAATLAATSAKYLYYKPIIEYRPSDAILYRGMVRLEVSTSLIVSEVQAATNQLIRLTLIIAAIALAVGFVGAFILSTVIVVPIRKLVAQIERIRDTDDKESLEGSKIEVKSKDELFTLADTVNQMTQGLVEAAKASKELIIGKGIQKMFIPLDPAPGSKVKLSTGRRDEKDFEVFGYYEGADAVSGDYWDFRSINSRYHYFIKCDVSGHGVPAALIMVQVATMVINYFNDWKRAMPKAIDLTDLAYKINDFLEERQFVGKFAAFTLGVWDSQEGVAYLCDAGDRILHIWDDKASKLIVEELPDSPAAGPLASILIQMKQPFSQVTRKLRPNDVLFLYTDGIEESKRYFRDQDYKIVTCTDVEKEQPHENHKGGVDNEEFGYDRLTAVLDALASRGTYRLQRQHDPAALVLSFDFSSCEGSLADKIIAPVAIEKAYRFYRDSATTSKDAVLVDQKVDAFLEKHFDQYRLYCSDKTPNEDPENPGYMLYHGLKEDPQWDDLTFLAIRRK